jgi:hypothetical protein
MIAINSTATVMHLDIPEPLASLPNIGTEKLSWPRRNLVEIQKQPSATYLGIILAIGHIKREWKVSLDGNNDSLPIATVDGVAPTDIDDLHDKLEAIMI